MLVETRQDEPSGWCFRRDVDSTSFSHMIPFLAWEILNYELKPSTVYSLAKPLDDVCACLSYFLLFFVCAFPSLLMSFGVMSGFEMIELDASHWTPNMSKRCTGCMPQAMTQKVIDIEEIIKTDHLFHPMRQLQRRSGAFLFKKKTNKWRLSLNHVEACFRMLRSTSLAIVNLTMRVFFSMQAKTYPLYNCFSVDN